MLRTRSRCIFALILTVTLVGAQTVLRQTPARALSLVSGVFDTWTSYAEGRVYVTGWAVTSDLPQVPLGIRVEVDNVVVLAGDAYRIANKPRPDVRAYILSVTGIDYGENHGFAFSVPFPSGSHTVTVAGQNNGLYNQLQGAAVVGMPTFPAQPGDSAQRLLRFTGATLARRLGKA